MRTLLESNSKRSTVTAARTPNSGVTAEDADAATGKAIATPTSKEKPVTKAADAHTEAGKVAPNRKGVP